MKNITLPIFTAAVALLFYGAAYATDLTVEGVLTVTGTADIVGNTATIGSWVGDSSHAGLSLGYSEADGVSTITFDASRDLNTWFWRHNTTAGLISSMKLDDSHRLILLGNDGTTPGITLDPAGASSIAGSLVVNGTSTTLPNQQLTGNSSVITQALGDGRYLRQTGTNWAVGASATPTGAGSFALGNNSVATGDSTAASFALGTGAVAYTSSGHLGSVAIGNGASAGDASGNGGGIAIGNNSSCLSSGQALGENALSQGGSATAIGYDARAYGGYSTAIGLSTYVEGYKAQAFGSYLSAKGYGVTVVGVMNEIDSNATSNARVATDNCFVVGNGIDSEMGTATRSNAMTIKWNGDATHIGNVTVTKKVTATQGARFDDTVRLAPRGGLSMGQFTYEPNP